MSNNSLDGFPRFLVYMSHLLILGGLMIVSASIFYYISLFLCKPIFGLESADVISAMNNLRKDTVAVNGLRFVQSFSTLGTFLVPALVFPRVIKEPVAGFLQTGKKPGVKIIILASLLIIVSMPFISWLNEINRNLKLPAEFSSIEEMMIQMEKKNEQLTKTLLTLDSFSLYLVSLLIIAVIPALSEEFFFRGVLQNFLKKWSGSVHLSVFVAAILFSAIHFQFFGFLPRFFAGLIMGYLLVWTGSIWVPVIAHLVNNSLGVTAYYLEQSGNGVGFLSENYSFPLYGVLISVCLISGISWLIIRHSDTINNKFVQENTTKQE